MITSTSTSSDFRRYMTENEALPPDCTLGYIAYFTVGDGAYDAAAMERTFMRLNLNPQFLPGDINPADAYEKASKEVQGHKYEVVGGATAEILIREADRTNNQIIRKIIREVRDSDNRRLLYDEVGEFVFYRPKAVNGIVDPKTAAVRSSLATSVSESERPVLTDVVRQFDQAYDRYRNYHDGQRIRAVLRNYLLHLNAIQMKPSVYFVHNTRGDELLRLREAVANLLPGSGTSLTLLPLPDLPSLRVEVTDAFQREAEKDLMEVASEIAKLRATRKGPIKSAAVAKIKDRYDEVIAKAGEYSRTLQCSQDRTSTAAEIAYTALFDLMQEVLGASGGGEG